MPHTASPPSTPRKNIHGLPPTYLLHLRALLRQFLSQQLAPPDEGLPGPSNRNHAPDRPLWPPGRLEEIEQAIWGAVLENPGGGKEGLLGCDWEAWAAGSRLRKAAWKKETQILPKAGSDPATDTSEPTLRDRALKLPVAGLLPSALSSAMSTPTKPGRAPSIASSTRSREPGRAATPQVEVAQSHDHPHPQSEEDQLAAWCYAIRGLKGFLPLGESQKEGWEELEDQMPLRTPIREFPGAFPQAYSSHSSSAYFGNSLVSLAASPRRPPPAEPLPSILKPIICLSFISSAPAYNSGSARSQSTLRFGRESSAGPDAGSSRSRHGSMSGTASGGTGSGGLGSLGGWFGNKWSEMTAGTEEGKVEIDFVPGRFALTIAQGRPARRRSSTIRKRLRESTGDDNTDTDDPNDNGSEDETSRTDDSHDSTWSGTERGHSGAAKKDRSENVVVAGMAMDIPVAAASRGEVGVVGGTLVIRGVKREPERRGIERVFKAIVYTIQCHALELSLLDAFSIPREPDPPPPLIAKPDYQRTRTTVELPRSTSPALGRANSQGQGGRKGFFAKLGLGPNPDGGKGVGRGMWDGLMGKRRASQAQHLPAEEEMGATSEDGDALSGLIRRTSLRTIRDQRAASVSTSQPATSLFTPPPPTQGHYHHMSGIERHLYLLAHLRGMVHSTTPGLVFPLPAILLRVEEEDRIRREKAGEEIKAESGGSGAATPVPQRWSPPIPAQPFQIQARPAQTGAGRARGLSTVSTSTAGTAVSSGTGIDGLPLGIPLALPPRIDNVHGRALGYRLGGDIRSGLTSLAGNLEGWEGWCRLQRIEYVYWMGIEEVRDGESEGKAVKGQKGVIACSKPVGSVHRFYDPESDVTIEDYLSGLADELGISVDSPTAPSDEDGTDANNSSAPDASSGVSVSGQDQSLPEDGHASDESGSWEPVCGRPECGVAERDHLRIWATGGGRVTGRIGKVIREAEGPLDGLRAQVECDTCKAQSGWRAMGIVGAGSWNKFLELIMYSSILIAPSLCPHAAQAAPGSAALPAHTFTYILSTPSFTLRLTSEPHPVLDTRLPKLQVGPLVAKRKTGSEAAKTASDAFIASSAKSAQPDEAEAVGAVPEEKKGMKLPGSAVLVKEDEPASVISFALSSLAYFTELCGGSAKPAASPMPPAEKSDASSVDLPASQAKEAWKIEVTRRDTPRDILPLRALTKKRSEISLPASARLPLTITSNQPSLELNLQPVIGHSGTRDGGAMDDLVKSISKATAQAPILTTSSNGNLAPSVISRPASTEPTTLAIPPSASSLSLSESEVSADQEKTYTPRARRRPAGDAPPSSFRRTVSVSVSSSANNSPRSTPTPAIGTSTPPRSSRDKENLSIHPSPAMTATSSLTSAYGDKDKEGWGGSVTSSFTSSFNTLLKLGTDVTDSLASRVRSGPSDQPSRSLASIMNPLHFASASTADSVPSADDTRPHIQLDFSHPTYKLSCTVYFASAFDTLRRRCAFDRSFVRSLEKSVGWMAEGGKSKANFWKTEDGRLVIKSLVTKWNVSDLQALLEIAPAYFEHMATTHNKATALAKIVGFYTVKMHDVATGEKRTMDLLVMENLFWKQEIDRTFDLKGIEARRVPKGKENGSTMFDAEWLEAQATSPLFVHPHAKRILLDSLTTDTRFLSCQSIIDYSLLLGLDRSRSELVVGLVDAVGSYGLFKNLESIGKVALNRGREGEVTIIPPDQYRERFETALRSYFTACPDKWSRSPKRTGAVTSELPVVF